MQEQLERTRQRIEREEQRLLVAYTTIGVDIMELPYTEAFDRLVWLVSPDPERIESIRSAVWRRLVTLSDFGKLPQFDYRA